MRKYAILLILWTLILFNTTVFASSDYLLQAIYIGQPQVARIYTNFSQKINERVSGAQNQLSSGAKQELTNIMRNVEKNFLALEIAVNNRDRNTGLPLIATLQAEVRQINTIIITSKFAPVADTNNSAVQGDINAVTSPISVLYYADNFEGGGTSGGNRFSQVYFSSANCSIPLHTFTQVVAGGKSVIVKNNDRPNCSLHPDIIDLSTSAFRSLAPLSRGRLQWGYIALGAAPKVFTKQYIPTDFFADQNITLDEHIPNAYLAGETFHISGHTIDSKTQDLIAILLPSGEKKIIAQDNDNGVFDFSVSLSTVGKYGIIVASGLWYEKATFFEFQVFDPKIFAGKRLVDANYSPIDTFEVSRQEYRNTPGTNIVHLPAWEFHEITIQQDTNIVRFSGMGNIALPVDALQNFDTKKSVVVTIMTSKSSTYFSHDTYTVPKAIFQKTMILAESYDTTKTDQIDVSIEGNEIVIRGILSEDAKVEPQVYVTFPDGFVKEIWFDPGDIQGGGQLLQVNSPIEKRIAIGEPGEYTVEINDNTGHAVLNKPVIKGDVLPLAPNRKDQVKNQDFSHLEKTQAQTLSLGYINDFRTKLWLASIAADADLNALAMLKVQDMVAYNYVGHVDSEWTRIDGMAERNNIKLVGDVGENIAWGNQYLEVLFAGLTMSGGHRLNLLQSEWKKVGIGYAEKDGNIYYVQVFGE